MPADPAALRAWLQESPDLRSYLRLVQARLNWVPREALNLGAEHFQSHFMAAYEMVAFSSLFSLEERGRVHIEVCAGLACREVGSYELLEALEKLSGLSSGSTAPDGSLSLCRQSCFGRCAIGPNARIQGQFHSGLSPAGAEALLKSAGPIAESR